MEASGSAIMAAMLRQQHNSSVTIRPENKKNYGNALVTLPRHHSVNPAMGKICRKPTSRMIDQETP
jgi:hypothetical protein